MRLKKYTQIREKARQDIQMNWLQEPNHYDCPFRQGRGGRTEEAGCVYVPARFHISFPSLLIPLKKFWCVEGNWAQSKRWWQKTTHTEREVTNFGEGKYQEVLIQDESSFLKGVDSNKNGDSPRVQEKGGRRNCQLSLNFLEFQEANLAGLATKSRTNFLIPNRWEPSACIRMVKKGHGLFEKIAGYFKLLSLPNSYILMSYPCDMNDILKTHLF